MNPLSPAKSLERILEITRKNCHPESVDPIMTRVRTEAEYEPPGMCIGTINVPSFERHIRG